MTLEDILKTAKQDLWDRPDEWIRKQYQQVGNKIPEGRLYRVTSAISVGSVLSLFGAYYLVHSPSTKSVYEILTTYPERGIGDLLFATMLGIMFAQDINHNIYGLRGWFKESHTDELRSKSMLEEEYKERGRCVRFPFFMIGSIASAYALYTIASGYAFERSYHQHLTYATLLEGIFFLGNASSIYLKDRDRKKFRKDPFWNRAYDALAEKINSYGQQPVPAPVQVRL